jgi:dipeptidase E
MRRLKIFLLALAIFQNVRGQDTTSKTADKVIFIAGDSFEDSKPFIKYVASLTHKANPKICLIPTASADNPYGIVAWYSACVDLPVKPYVMRTFISAYPSQQSFEEFIFSMDAIIVGGGNTLNMLGIWKAQGIDTVLKKAYDKGIVLSGGSAGSLCWFTGGYSDSRPKELTIIQGLGLLNFSHSPHYNSQPERRPLFQQGILSGNLKPGYACDDLAGLLFINGAVKKSISQDAQNNSYFVSVVDGKIVEKVLPSEIIKQ